MRKGAKLSSELLGRAARIELSSIRMKLKKHFLYLLTHLLLTLAPVEVMKQVSIGIKQALGKQRELIL